MTWRVSKWFLHPNYITSSKGNSTEQGDFDQYEKLKNDTDLANGDLGLLKVELDNEILSQVDVNTDNGDMLEEDDVFYETFNDAGLNLTRTEPEISVCLELLARRKRRARKSRSSVFPLPVELERHPFSSLEPDSFKPKRAYCYAVGHSAVDRLVFICDVGLFYTS